jgi:hypothetical protein
MYYVYELIDPRDNMTFYVGKGKGRRAITHLWAVPETRNAYKEHKIAAIREDGYEPIIKYVVENIVDEKLAYDIEAMLIKKYGRKGYDQDGVLTNVCEDARPPNHKGKTYEEIYGPERAQQQRELRATLQKARGGYGPKHHTLETKLKIKEKSKGEKNGMYGKKHSAETIQKIKDNRLTKAGQDHQLSKCYELIDPVGKSYILYGGELYEFCKEHNLSVATFRKNMSNGWPPSKRGRNVGWKINKLPT